MIYRPMRSTAFLLLAMTVCGASCADYAARVEDYGVSTVQFSDIPVPDGMKLKTHGPVSHSFERGVFRHGDFEYYGGIEPSAAESYMRERMDSHGWRLTDDRVTEAGTSLRFERAPYESHCRIWDDDGMTLMRVEVRTAVAPAR